MSTTKSYSDSFQDLRKESEEKCPDELVKILDLIGFRPLEIFCVKLQPQRIDIHKHTWQATFYSFVDAIT